MAEWTHIDKTAWGDGPWQSEPDKIHWIDPESDMDCLMVRHERSGHWCGYVGVTEGHPLFEKDYDEHYAMGIEIDVHGGLTFAEACSESEDPGRGICHVPLEGRPDHVWWFGFDCHHGGDLSPAGRAQARFRGESPPFFERDDVYRDRAYVEEEVRSLARQLRAVSG